MFNAGLKVPEGTTIMWVNDNFGYIRRLWGGGIPAAEGGTGDRNVAAPYRQGIYWHLS